MDEVFGPRITTLSGTYGYPDFRGGERMTYALEVLECPGCGWWQLEQQAVDGFNNDNGGDYILSTATLREFSIDSPAVPLDLLADEIRNRQEVIHHIHPSRLEELAASVFSDFFACEVVHCGRTGDGGTDLLLVHGDETIPIQVKRRSKPDAAESVQVVREMFGVMFRDGYRHAKVLSTAKRFSSQSRLEVQKVLREQRCDSFELIDRDAFMSMLRLQRRQRMPPWVGQLPFFQDTVLKDRFIADYSANPHKYAG